MKTLTIAYGCATAFREVGAELAVTYLNKTRAASGLKDFGRMLNEAVAPSPVGELVDIMDVGYFCAFLAAPFGRRLAGQVVYVDGGANIMV